MAIKTNQFFHSTNEIKHKIFFYGNHFSFEEFMVENNFGVEKSGVEMS